MNEFAADSLSKFEEKIAEIKAEYGVDRIVTHAPLVLAILAFWKPRSLTIRRWSRVSTASWYRGFFFLSKRTTLQLAIDRGTEFGW